MKNEFKDVIGQEKAKSRFTFYLDSYKSGGTVPNMLLIAPKGTGKTFLAERFGIKVHEASGGIRACHLVNCSTIKNLRAFVNQVLIKHLTDKHATIILDEAHELKRDIGTALLTLLAPNPAKRNTFIYDDYPVEMIFSNHSFIFATTEAQRMDPALVDRCVRVELEEYNYDEVGQIIKKVVKSISAPALVEASKVCRGNARSAILMAEEMERFMQQYGKNTFSIGDWNMLANLLGINPLGLSNIEVQILKILKNCPNGVSLNGLAAATGLTRDVIMKDIEMYPIRHKLMRIEGKRIITAEGLDYLKMVEN